MAKRHHRRHSGGDNYWVGLDQCGHNPNKCALYFYNNGTGGGSTNIILEGKGNAWGDYEISEDGENWTTWANSGDRQKTYALATGHYLYVRNASSTPIYPNYYDSNNGVCWVGFHLATQVLIGGNARSMLCQDWSASYTCPDYCLYGLFCSYQAMEVDHDSGLFAPIQWCDRVYDSSYHIPLTLDYTTLSGHCYECMFYNMFAYINIGEEVPDSLYLPAENAAPYCYRGMFYYNEFNNGDHSYDRTKYLIYVGLRNTASHCCDSMFKKLIDGEFESISNLNLPSLGNLAEYSFYECFAESGLKESMMVTHYSEIISGVITHTNAGLLNTTAGIGCCSRMFTNCEDLKQFSLPLYINISHDCYYEMYKSSGSQSTGSDPTHFVTLSYYHGDPILPALNLAVNCYYSMFDGCPNLIEAPILPAETLVTNCYVNLLKGCSKISYAKALFTTGIPPYYQDWLSGVASTGMLVKNTAAPSGIDASVPSSGGNISWVICTTQTERFWIRNEDSTQNLSITIKSTGSSLTKKVNVCLETATIGQSYTIDATGITQTVPPKKRLIVSAVAQAVGGTDTLNNSSYQIKISSSGTSYSAGGVLNYLMSSNGYSATGQTYSFYRLFDSSAHLIYAHNLNICGSSAAATYAYSRMFYNCTSLIYPPQHIISVANYSHSQMFRNCESLVESPIMSPGSQDAVQCESYMFYDCTSLKEIRNYCTNPGTTVSTNSPRLQWIYNVPSGSSSGGVFYRYPNASWTVGAIGYPAGWSVVNVDPSKYFTTDDTNKVYYLEK